MTPRLSIVIVNYNTRDDLRACLIALADDSIQPEIIVVDNASKDGSAEVVIQTFPQVRLLAQTRNTWFCGGNNLGIAAATGDYILLLNPDTVVPPGALAALVSFLDIHPDYQGVTMQMRYPDGSIQRTCSRIPTYSYLLLQHTPLGWLFPGQRAKLAADHWYTGWGRDTDQDVAVLPGSCLMMRRGGWQLNPDLLLYFPEDDLARRFAGAKFRFLASHAIIHKEKAATQTWLATRVYFRDLLVYSRQHHGLPGWALLWLLSRPLLAGMWLKRRLNPTVPAKT
jgi:GT2 family glycosyltransferase